MAWPVLCSVGWVYCLPYLHLPQPRLAILVQIHIDREMGVDISHLVFETFRDADDEVVDEGADGAEGGDVLAGAVVHFDVDDVFLRVREGDGDVAEVFDEFAPRAFDCYDAGFDVDFDYAEERVSVSADLL